MNTSQNPKKQNHSKGILGKTNNTVFRGLGRDKRIMILVTILCGLSLFLYGNTLQHKNNQWGTGFEAFAILITVDATWSIINHARMQNQFKEELSNVILEQLPVLIKSLIHESNATITKNMQDALLVLLQSIIDIKNVSSLGVSNLFKSIDLKKILVMQNNSPGGTIILQRLFFSEKEFDVLKESLRSLILKHDKVIQILFQSPAVGALTPGNDELLNNSKQIQAVTNIQLAQLQELKNELPAGKRKNLQLKVHQNLDIVSLTGFDDRLIHASYLGNRLIDAGIHIEVRGRSSDLYKEWISHFVSNWTEAR